MGRLGRYVDLIGHIYLADTFQGCIHGLRWGFHDREQDRDIHLQQVPTDRSLSFERLSHSP
jgi:hypothetical protein